MNTLSYEIQMYCLNIKYKKMCLDSANFTVYHKITLIENIY